MMINCQRLLCWLTFPLLGLLVVSSSVDLTPGMKLILTPKDVELVATGDTLQLTCSLSGFPDEVTSENVYFMPMDNNSKTEVIDAKSIRFERTNMTRGQPVTIFACSARGYENIIEQIYVTVADKPVEPNNITCVVDNWKNMTCRWEPSEQDSGIPVTQSLYWRISGAGEIFRRCPHYGEKNSSCAFKAMDGANSFEADMIYILQVNVTNALGSKVSNRTVINTAYFVKPSAVQNINVEPTSRSFIISWQESHAGDNSLYQITYRPQWKNVEYKTVNTTNSTLVLVDLEPFTEYYMSIKCIPLLTINNAREARGFWSDIRTISAKTPSDVPGQVPAVTAGGYRITSDQSGKRTIEVFWQRIPERYRHGQIRKYQVVQESALETVNHEVDGTKVSEKFVLNKDIMYWFTVNAETDKGRNQTISLTSIIIPKIDSQPRLREKFVVRVDEASGNVFWNWTAVEDAVGYTVYWCDSLLNHNRPSTVECDDELHWHSVPKHETSFTISFNVSHSLLDDMLFGLSVEVGVNKTMTVSSGLVWSDCTYNTATGVGKPNNFRFSLHQEIDSLMIEWQRPNCRDTNYISHYVVSSCNSDEFNCAENSQDWTEEIINDPARTSFTINNLKGYAVYQVKIKSASYTGHSNFTGPIRQRVLRRQEPRLRQHFVVLGDEASGNVYWNWTAVEDAIGYTVYWCETMNHNRPNTVDCDDHLRWQSVPKHETSVTKSFIINHSLFDGMLFGLSVEVEVNKTLTVSSGLVWSDCTYNTATGVGEPYNFHFSLHQQTGSLMIEWQRPKCCDTNYISHYVVSSCNSDDSDCAENTQDWTEEIINNPASTSFTINNLQAEAVYQVKIKSASYIGQSNFTGPIQQRVLRRPGSTIKGAILGTVISCAILLFGFIGVFSFTFRYFKKSTKKSTDVELRDVTNRSQLRCNQVDMPKHNRQDPTSEIIEEEHEPMLTTFSASSVPHRTHSKDNAAAF